MDQISQFAAAIVDDLLNVLLLPLTSTARIFWLYLLTSAAVAWFVYRAVRRKSGHATDKDAAAASGTFIQFLFPRSVWTNPSAWLDVRYLFFHRTVSAGLIGLLGTLGIALGFRLSTGGMSLTALVATGGFVSFREVAIGCGMMIVLLLILDLIAWGLHYLQHRVPLLWQFHKVHHSAEVMHPISNFREHPVDNIVYSFFISFGYGICYGIAVRFFGFAPSMPLLFGIPVLMFAFNIAGYNLRHSHVWLRWPGIWSTVFPSPAHHHVHHSCHPDHIDKNFAFMFPIWDVIFGTYTMPNDNRDVRFGVPEEEGRNLDTVLNLYFVPFRDAYRLFVPKSPPQTSDEASPDTVRFPAE